jgi:hypothetical protein
MARRYIDAIRPFLRTRLSPDGMNLDLEHLSSRDVTTFVVTHTPKQSRPAAKTTMTTLRSFLRFLHVEGAIPQSLVATVPSVAGCRLAGLPKGIAFAEVQRLLAACDNQTPAGKTGSGVASARLLTRHHRRPLTVPTEFLEGNCTESAQDADSL